jgi:osmotically-inducible protein OsmY
VVLRGRAANEAARQQVVQIARQIPGVRGVVDLLRVPMAGAKAAGFPNGSGPPSAAATSDRQVRWAVDDAMFYDPRVNAFAPDVEVHDGIVTLTGVVASPEAKQAAVEDARNARGVLKVADRLEVRQAGAPSR